MESYFETLPIELLEMVLIKKSISSEDLLSLYLYFDGDLSDIPTNVTLGFLQKISDDRRFWALKDPDFQPSVGFNLDLYNHHSKCKKCMDLVSDNYDTTLIVYYKDIPTIDLLTGLGTTLSPPKSMREIGYTVVKDYIRSKLHPESDAIVIWTANNLYRNLYEDMFYNFFYNHIKMRVTTKSVDFTFSTPEEFLRNYQE